MPRRRHEVIIGVVWDDAHRTSGEVAPHELDHKPYRFTTVGILLRSDGVGVSVAGEVGQDGRFRDIDFIPRAMVVEEFEIAELKKRRRRGRTAAGSDVSAVHGSGGGSGQRNGSGEGV